MELGFLLGIAILLLFAKIFGEIAERMKISSMVGELFGGIMAGPVLHIVSPDPLLSELAGLGILLLLFIIGLSTDFDSVKGDIYKGSALAIAGCGLSFVAGFIIGWLLFNSIEAGLLLATAIVSTSTAITVRSLAEIGEYHTKVGRMALTIDIADEVFAILALSFFIMYISKGALSIWVVLGIFFTVIGFMAVIITAGTNFCSRFLDIFKISRDDQILLSMPLVIAFLVAFASEHFHIAAVTGAFLAGMAMSKSQLTKPVIIPKMKSIGHGFFIPIFFAYSALSMDLSSLAANLWLILALVAVAIAAKFIGIGLLSRIFGFEKREQILLTIGMIPRGEYSIVVAQLALTAAIISQQLYTTIIAFVLISIIITPILLRLAAKRFSNPVRKSMIWHRKLRH